VEGAPEAIERAIAVLGLPRPGFNAESVFWFMQQYEQRTGVRACLADADLAAVVVGGASPVAASHAAPEGRRG
jgi:hypothetical protein